LRRGCPEGANGINHEKRSAMSEYTSEYILTIIRDELIQRLDMNGNADVRIITRGRHRHSRSAVLEVEDGNRSTKVFVKWGARFSGSGAWDIRSEYEGYVLVCGMELDEKNFFSVRPLLVREKPPILVTTYVDGRMLSLLYKRSLLWPLGNVGRENEQFTRRTAQWLNLFLSAVKEGVRDVSKETILDFCRCRAQEIAEWDRGAADEDGSLLAGIDRLARSLFEMYGDTVHVVRNHGDFAPHNILIDPHSRLGVIDLGFKIDEGHPLPFEDAAAFLIYLEQMENNPLYRHAGLDSLKRIFIEELVGGEKGRTRELASGYFKKLLAHVAWVYHPQRRPAGTWGEYSLRRWGRLRLRWLKAAIDQGGLRGSVCEFLYL